MVARGALEIAPDLGHAGHGPVGRPRLAGNESEDQDSQAQSPHYSRHTGPYCARPEYTAWHMHCGYESRRCLLRYLRWKEVLRWQFKSVRTVPPWRGSEPTYGGRRTGAGACGGGP